MKSFACGNIKIKEDDFKNALAIYNEINRLDQLRSHHNYLKQRDYGHKFGRDRKCTECGIWQKDYHMMLYENRNTQAFHYLLCKGKPYVVEPEKD